MSGFDANEFKKQQERTWSALAAAWEKWDDAFERGGAVVTRRLIDLAALGPGQRVLDIGTGLGEPALSAATAVGAQGRVLGVDVADPMLAIARSRAAAKGLRHIELVTADAEAFTESELFAKSGPFDAVISRFGLMFLPDARGVLERSVAALKPGGRCAASVWSTPDKVPMIAFTFGVLGKAFELPPPPPGTPSPFTLANAAALTQLLEGAGLTAVRVEEQDVPFRFETIDEFVAYSWELLPPFLRAKVDALDPARQAELRAAVTRAAGAYQRDGRVDLTSRALLVSGVRAAGAS